jgi:hypothetical protein
MKHFTFFLVAVAAVAGLVVLVAPAPGHAPITSARTSSELRMRPNPNP